MREKPTAFNDWRSHIYLPDPRLRAKVGETNEAFRKRFKDASLEAYWKKIEEHELEEAKAQVEMQKQMEAIANIKLVKLVAYDTKDKKLIVFTHPLTSCYDNKFYDIGPMKLIMGWWPNKRAGMNLRIIKPEHSTVPNYNNYIHPHVKNYPEADKYAPPCLGQWGAPIYRLIDNMQYTDAIYGIIEFFNSSYVGQDGYMEINHWPKLSARAVPNGRRIIRDDEDIRITL